MLFLGYSKYKKYGSMQEKLKKLGVNLASYKDLKKFGRYIEKLFNYLIELMISILEVVD